MRMPGNRKARKCKEGSTPCRDEDKSVLVLCLLVMGSIQIVMPATLHKWSFEIVFVNIISQVGFRNHVRKCNNDRLCPLEFLQLKDFKVTSIF